MTTLCTKLYHTVLTWFGQKWSGGAEGRGHFSHAPTASTYIFLYNSYLSRSIVDTYMQLIIALFMAGKLVKHNLMVKTMENIWGSNCQNIIWGVQGLSWPISCSLEWKIYFQSYNFESSLIFLAIKTSFKSLVCLLLLFFLVKINLIG